MKRPGYRQAIEWVACNDSCDAVGVEECGYITSAVMVAHLWDVPHEKVGADIVKVRESMARTNSQ